MYRVNKYVKRMSRLVETCDYWSKKRITLERQILRDIKCAALKNKRKKKNHTNSWTLERGKVCLSEDKIFPTHQLLTCKSSPDNTSLKILLYNSQLPHIKEAVHFMKSASISSCCSFHRTHFMKLCDSEKILSKCFKAKTKKYCCIFQKV